MGDPGLLVNTSMLATFNPRGGRWDFVRIEEGEEFLCDFMHKASTDPAASNITIVQGANRGAKLHTEIVIAANLFVSCAKDDESQSRSAEVSALVVISDRRVALIHYKRFFPTLGTQRCWQQAGIIYLSNDIPSVLEMARNDFGYGVWQVCGRDDDDDDDTDDYDVGDLFLRVNIDGFDFCEEFENSILEFSPLWQGESTVKDRSVFRFPSLRVKRRIGRLPGSAVCEEAPINPFVGIASFLRRAWRQKQAKLFHHEQLSIQQEGTSSQIDVEVCIMLWLRTMVAQYAESDGGGGHGKGKGKGKRVRKDGSRDKGKGGRKGRKSKESGGKGTGKQTKTPRSRWTVAAA